MSTSILLCDDHGIVRDGIATWLQRQPSFEVIAAIDNGQDAVRLAVELRPDVAVLDHSMPGMSGTEAARQIRLDSPSTRIIVLSMHSSLPYVVQALKAGVSAYVLKTAAGSDLVEAVNAVMLGRRYISYPVWNIIVDAYISQVETFRDGSLLNKLSRREREILQMVVEGRSSMDIANQLNLSVGTVDTYRSRLMAKLNVDNLPDLVKFALKQGLISLD